MVEQTCAVERVLHGSVVREENRRGRYNLHIDAIPIHLGEAYFSDPTCGINVSEESVADENLGFAWLSVLDPRPIGCTVASRKIGPVARKEMIVNIDNWHSDDWHLYCLPGWRVPQCLHLRRLSSP